jgi:hypothetical protein
MAKRKRREPRPPTAVPSLPATFAAAEEEEILAGLEHWYGHVAEKLSSEASHEAIRDDMVRQLERGDGATLPLAYIVAMADAKHPPADHALRIFIHAAIDADRFAALPLQVRAYAQRALLGPPLPIGYPSNRLQVASDYARDNIVSLLVDLTVAQWPHVPKLHSGSRHSAAWLLAVVFARHGIKPSSERQVRRICNTRLPPRLAEFLLAGLPFK